MEGARPGVDPPGRSAYIDRMTDDDFQLDEDRPGGPQPIDHRAAPTRVGLIVPDVRGVSTNHTIEMRLQEFEGLARAINVDVVFAEIIRVREVKPATFLGSGVVAELK